MEDLGSFGPAVVVAVGLADTAIEQLREECAVRKFRLIVADRKADLPLSIQCDFAIIGTLLPDADGRTLATDFVRAGANVLIVDNAGQAAVADAWRLGATVAGAQHEPADWLDRLTETEHVDAVLRAGKLLEALRLADSVESAASFSAATGVPVSLVRIRAGGEGRSGLDEALDRLTSVVGTTTVFYDTPDGERLALVVNGDRRRLLRLLNDRKLNDDTSVAVVEVKPKDDLAAIIGRSRLSFRIREDEDTRPRVVVAVGSGQDKISETLRSSLHRMEFTPLFWDTAFEFDDVRSNTPMAVVIESGLPNGMSDTILRSALEQDPPIPTVVVSEEEKIPRVRAMLDDGASDFLIWPFTSGEVQASIARAMTVGSVLLKAAASERTLQDEAEATEAEATEPEPVAEAPVEPVSEAHHPDGPKITSPTSEIERAESAAEHERENENAESKATESAEGALAEIIGQRLASGKPITFEGIGTLSVTHETSRIVHDEKGRTIVEPPRRLLTFEPKAPSTSDDAS